MPISKANRALYPKAWQSEIVLRILKRAGHRCEQCGLNQYSVGYRDAEGVFYRNGGNLDCDASGYGQHPNGEPLTYAEAKEFADASNDCRIEGNKQYTDEFGNRWIVVILTIAHLDPDPADCRDGNLRCYCCRCHNRLDMPMRVENRRKSREAKQGVRQRVMELG